MKKEILNSSIEYFLEVVEKTAKEKTASKQTIFRLETSEIAGQMALWYEKVRGAVQYKEEHLLRRTTIYRILKRLVDIEQKKNKRDLVYALFKELAMAGHINQSEANDELFERVEEIVARYLKVLQLVNSKIRSATENLKIRRWFFSLASEEIENQINPQKEKMALIYAIYETLRPKIKFNLSRPPFPLPGSKIKGMQVLAEEYLGVGSLVEPIENSIVGEQKRSSARKTIFNEEKLFNLLVYLAVFRNLRKSDRAMIRFLVFNIYFPKWTELTDKDEEKLAEAIKLLLKKRVEIEIIAEHPLMPKILFPIKKYMLCSAFFYEAIMDNPAEARAIASQEYLLWEKIKNKCNLRYLAESKKLKKRIGRGILYVFLTKMIVALILEVPYEMMIKARSIEYRALAINLFFPPVLLSFIASSARKPDEENTKEILKGVSTLIYRAKLEEDLKNINISDRESAWAERMLDLFYILVLFTVLYSLIKLLHYLDFNFVATMIFLIFTGTVSFFGALIRQSTRDLVITKDREGFFSLIFDTALLPFVRIGRLLSVKFSRINVFIFILDFLVEAPFKFIIRAFEAWIDFLRKKRDEVERQFD